MNAFVLIIPVVLIRYGLLNIIGKESLSRAAYFAPLHGNEKAAFWIYQISNTFMLLYLFFLRVIVNDRFFLVGLMIYFLGLCLYTASTVNFAKPKKGTINENGLYQFSRNPMYVAYFIIFSGLAILTESSVLMVALFIFQIASHWIILSEERWCIEKFGNDYRTYMKKVRRYF
jgi:protein-S-isoprenylcysteine O-methyltransferase Ste14